jgi:hypothetical protein
MIFDTDMIKEKYLKEVKETWLTTEAAFPDLLSECSTERKQINEAYISSAKSRLQEPMNHMPKVPWRRKHWRQNVLKLVEELLYEETVINLHSSMAREELIAFQEELKEFLRQARTFAPELSFDEIGQAFRNYIVYAMFKRIHKDGSGFSLAGFGYSMLYPFTDNFIDNISSSFEDKAEYNQIIRNKLEGNEVFPRTVHQIKTCELLDDIEKAYPRKTHPMAFQLLLLMLDAQEASLLQQNSTCELSPLDCLNISIYKGGISVFIDRYFVDKELTEADLFFYIGMGFFLQLADDLQDIGVDSAHGSQTLFTLDLDPTQEENLVNKLLQFIHNIMDSYQAENNQFKNFILLNCYQLIYISVLRSKAFFSAEYLEKIERLLPVTRHYYDEFIRDMSFHEKVQNTYFKMLDELILA